MSIKAITADGITAINKIKNATKTKVLTFNDFISNPSKELKNKVNYMRSDSFWKDEHNVKMYSLYEKLSEYRDNISKSISKNNENPNNSRLVQGINGFARFENFLNINPKMNFSGFTSVNDRANLDYKFAKTFIYNLSREFKSKIGR